jgi:hypothetical protein
MHGIDFEKEFISTTLLLMWLAIFLFLFLVVCVWLGSANSLVNRDIKIQHFEKVVFQGVNKVVMEHLVKLYRNTTLGYMLLAYDGRKSLYIIRPLPFPSKEFRISLLGEDDASIP